MDSFILEKPDDLNVLDVGSCEGVAPCVCFQMKLSNQQMPAAEENVTAYALACCCLFMQVPSRPQL